MIKYICFLLLFSVNAFASEKSHTAALLKHLSPHLTNNVAEKYAIIIDKYSKVFDVEAEIAITIFKQESDFIHKAVNYKSRDFGIGQINYINIIRRNIDLGELLTNPEYAIKESFKFLSELKKKYNTNAKGWRRWFTRYNSFRWKYRKEYYQLLERHLKRIEEFLNEQNKKDSNRNGTH